MSNVPVSPYGKVKRGYRADIDMSADSRWEANYARYLNLRKSLGEIKNWEHEPITFHFDGVTRGAVQYTPDFRVILPDGRKYLVEIKGWERSFDRTKWKRLAKQYPEEELMIIRRAEYTAIEKQYGKTIDKWEW